jgi:hypothetical protein
MCVCEGVWGRGFLARAEAGRFCPNAGRELSDQERGPQRAGVTIKLIMRQLCEAIKLCHDAGEPRRLPRALEVGVGGHSQEPTSPTS